jgi:hypothetical protein
MLAAVKPSLSPIHTMFEIRRSMILVAAWSRELRILKLRILISPQCVPPITEPPCTARQRTDGIQAILAQWTSNHNAQTSAFIIVIVMISFINNIVQ